MRHDENTRRFFHGGNDTARANLLNFTRALDKACHRQIRPFLVTRACKSVEDYMRGTCVMFFTGRLPKIATRRPSLLIQPKIISWFRENGLEIKNDRIYRASPTFRHLSSLSIFRYSSLSFFFFYTKYVCSTLCYFADALNVKK